MALTLLETVKDSEPTLKKAVAKTIVENSPILDRMPMVSVKGGAYRYNMEKALPGIAFRGVGGTYTASSGIYVPYMEPLAIVGGEVFVDNFQVEQQGNLADVKARQYALKARAMASFLNTQFFEGDVLTNALGFDGLRKRIGTAQAVKAATNGAALSLDMLDQALDKVPFDDKVIYCNRTLRRKITSLVRAASGAVQVSLGSVDEYGKQVSEYNGVKILVVEQMDDASTVLDFDETCGSSNVTASIYVVSFGEDRVHGLLGSGGSFDVRDFGETEAAPGHKGRIEAFVGMAIEHPRAAARIWGITNA